MAKRGKRSSDDVTDWHRLFGIVLTQLFEGFDSEVERELDLSIKQQLLDIVIIRRGQGQKTPILPDGFGPLADHNLLTYKSLHEPLDGWALKELAGHSVNYRKQRSPSLDDLLPEESIRLFAVATRFPEKPAGQITLQTQSIGVLRCRLGNGHDSPAGLERDSGGGSKHDFESVQRRAKANCRGREPTPKHSAWVELHPGRVVEKVSRRTRHASNIGRDASRLTRSGRKTIDC